MIPISVLVLVLGAIALAIGGVSLNAFMLGRIHTRQLAQMQEGYRQAICSVDEIGNKLMAMLDARGHAYYRQAAGPLGKPPAVRTHDGVEKPPGTRIREGSVAPADAEAIAAAQRKQKELEELAERNGVTISAPADYGAREPE